MSWLTVIVVVSRCGISVLVRTRSGIVSHFSYFFLSLRSLLLSVTFAVAFSQLLGPVHKFYTGAQGSCHRHITDLSPGQTGNGLPWLPEEWLPLFPLATPGKCLLLSVTTGRDLQFDAKAVLSAQPVGFLQGALLRTTPQQWGELSHCSQ